MVITLERPVCAVTWCCDWTTSASAGTRLPLNALVGSYVCSELTPETSQVRNELVPEGAGVFEMR